MENRNLDLKKIFGFDFFSWFGEDIKDFLKLGGGFDFLKFSKWLGVLEQNLNLFVLNNYGFIAMQVLIKLKNY